MSSDPREPGELTPPHSSRYNTRSKSKSPSKVTAGKPADSHRVVALEPIKERKRPISPDRAPTRADSGVLRSCLVTVSGPRRLFDRIFRRIVRGELNCISDRLRDLMLTCLYPDGNYEEANVITQDEFRLVVDYLLNSRVHHVCSKVTGRRDAGRTPLVSGMVIPKSLADIINQYGHVLVSHGFLEVIFY